MSKEKWYDMEGVLTELKNSFKDIPVYWDRVSEGESHLCIFGWIIRDSYDLGEPGVDYVEMIFHSLPEEEIKEGWCNFDFVATSSAKYSAQIAKNRGVDHSACIPFEKWIEGTINIELRIYFKNHLWRDDRE